MDTSHLLKYKNQVDICRKKRKRIEAKIISIRKILHNYFTRK